MNHDRRNHVSITGRAALLLAVLLALASLPAMAADHIIHVNHAAAGGANDGSSWGDAYTDLQAALGAAGADDEIWVAAGVYKPTDGADRTATFQLIDGVAIYGGFAGTETDREQRDWLAHITVLSGDIDDNDTSDANGVVVDADDMAGSNSLHVVTGSATDDTAILDGFVITAGLADGVDFTDRVGGGMFNESDAHPTLRNLVFSGNRADRNGGGMYNDQSSPTLSHLIFSGNRADIGGGMINNRGSSPALTHVSFSGNRADFIGGGMRNAGASSPTLTHVSFSGNRASDGGGMSNESGSSPTLTNVSFSGNRADGNGGGMFNDSSSPTLTHVSFSGNRADNSGGGMYNFESNPLIRNTIFWHNQDNSGTGTAAASIFNDDSTPQISYSLVQGCNPSGAWVGSCGTDGGNNLDDADPLFISTPNPANAPTSVGNLRLSAGSPALDVGNNAVVSVATDLAGNARIVNTTVDLGPYERPSSACPTGDVIHVDRLAIEPGDGQSWASAYTDLQDALTVTEPCEIWVAAGVYKPTDDTSHRAATFQLIDGVEIYGGFAGTEEQRDDRDWQAHLTVLSGDIDSNDTTNANDVVVDADDIVGSNSIHVVTGSATDATAILDGFVITAGLADGGFVIPCGPACGGGMYNVSGSPTLANITFSGNFANLRGGGMWNRDSSPALTQVRFSGNRAVDGGGMHNDGGNPTLTHVSFSGNGADSHGGGMVNDSSSPTLTHVSFSGNFANLRGGGMWNRDSSPTLTNVSFSGNRADFSGGGMFNLISSNPTLTNVSFSGNRATNNGGGMFNDEESNPLIRNTIFWHNQDNSGTGTAAASIFNDDSTPQISYSLVQGCNPDGAWNTSTVVCGTDGGNNLDDADPLFISTPDPAAAPTSAGNLRLMAGSPAIDAGNDAYVTVATDLDGNPRIIGPAVDLGPYENDAYLLTLDVVGSGMINATPLPDADTGGYALDTAVQLEAIADAGWSFAQWSGDLTGETNPGTLTIDGNMSVTATFTNDPPVADAGPDQSVNAGVEVTLDGSGSFDAAGDDITYQWTQVGGETVTLSDPTDVNPTFTAPFDPTPLVFELVVTDSLDQASDPDTVTISVILPEFEVTTSVGNGQGSITPDTQNVTWGEEASFTVTPEGGWSTTTVTGNTCNPMNTAEETWVASNITEDCAVEANFEVNQYSVGGEVSGLEGEGLTLDLNGIETLAISADGPFTFITELDHDTDYTVTITAQPTNPSQTCQIANAGGTINAADVTDIEVSCSTPSLSLSLGHIDFGQLEAGSTETDTVILTNNSSAPVTISEITEPQAPFALTGGSCLPPPTVLGPGESCSIEVSFTAQSQTGEHHSHFEILSDAPSSPDQVSLSGSSLNIIPVPVNRPATLLILALLLILAGGWRMSAGRKSGMKAR